MTSPRKHFSLEPFPGETGIDDIRVTGSIGRSGRILSVRYAIAGALSGIAIPFPAPEPERRDRLWEDTCLEFFIGPAGSEAYWEFNLSPSGHWNAYRFAGYRRGMEREAACDALPFDVQAGPAILALSVKVDIGKIVPADREMKAGVAAVLRHLDGRMGRWSLAHPGPVPDFHRQDGFLLRIPADRSRPGARSGG